MRLVRSRVSGVSHHRVDVCSCSNFTLWNIHSYCNREVFQVRVRAASLKGNSGCSLDGGYQVIQFFVDLLHVVGRHNPFNLSTASAESPAPDNVALVHHISHVPTMIAIFLAPTARIKPDQHVRALISPNRSSTKLTLPTSRLNVSRGLSCHIVCRKLAHKCTYQKSTKPPVKVWYLSFLCQRRIL